jgi:hypothetical protein
MNVVNVMNECENVIEREQNTRTTPAGGTPTTSKWVSAA